MLTPAAVTRTSYEKRDFLVVMRQQQWCKTLQEELESLESGRSTAAPVMDAQLKL